MILKWIMRSKPPDEKLTDRRPGEDSGLPADVQRGGSVERLVRPCPPGNNPCSGAWIGNTPSSTPASRIRWMFSETLNHRSVAQTCTPNSRCKKIDDDARPQPRSSTRMPVRKSSDAASHSVIQRALAPPLALAMTHSGWYLEERGNRLERSRLSEVMCI